MTIRTENTWFSFITKQWISSLHILLPHNFKPFLLVTLNAFLISIRIFFRYFWWVLILDSGMRMVYGSAWVNIRMVTFLVVLFFMQLSIRPSLQEKTWHYFMGYVPRFFAFSASFIIPLIAKILIDFFSPDIPLITVGKHMGYLFFNPLYFFQGLSPMFLYIGYFMFDSDGSYTQLISSIMKGWKMVIYTYPFCLISMSICAIGGWIGMYAIGFYYFDLISMIGSWLYYGLLGCWFNTIYIKKVHEDFLWY